MTHTRESTPGRAAAIVLLLVVVIGSAVAWWSYRSAPTTVLVVRHAEKASDEADTPLSDVGLARAADLARLGAEAGVTGVYASHLQRTRQTVMPLADRLGLPVVQIDARDVDGLAERILAEPAGSVLVVAGHSNTVPLIVEGLGAGSLCPSMFPPAPNGTCVVPDDQYDNLILVVIPRWGRTTAVRLLYGNPTP